MPSFSSTVITLNNWDWVVTLDIRKFAFTLGVWEKAELTVIVAPETDEIALLSNDPSGKITANVASPTGLPLVSTAKSVQKYHQQ